MTTSLDGLRVLGVDPGPHRCGWMLLRCGFARGSAAYVAGGLVASTRAALQELLQLHAPQAVAVERPRFHAISGASPLVMRSMAQQLVETTYVAARIIEMVRGQRVRVLEMPAGTWRKGLLGNGASTNAAIKALLVPLLKLPTKTNEHMRDAGGVALAAVRLLANGTEGGCYGRSAFDSQLR